MNLTDTPQKPFMSKIKWSASWKAIEMRKLIMHMSLDITHLKLSIKVVSNFFRQIQFLRLPDINKKLSI